MKASFSFSNTDLDYSKILVQLVSHSFKPLFLNFFLSLLSYLFAEIDILLGVLSLEVLTLGVIYFSSDVHGARIGIYAPPSGLVPEVRV